MCKCITTAPTSFFQASKNSNVFLSSHAIASAVAISQSQICARNGGRCCGPHRRGSAIRPEHNRAYDALVNENCGICCA